MLASAAGADGKSTDQICGAGFHSGEMTSRQMEMPGTGANPSAPLALTAFRAPPRSRPRNMRPDIALWAGPANRHGACSGTGPRACNTGRSVYSISDFRLPGCGIEMML